MMAHFGGRFWPIPACRSRHPSTIGSSIPILFASQRRVSLRFLRRQNVSRH